MSLEITPEEKILSVIDVLADLKQDICNIKEESIHQKEELEEQCCTIQDLKNKLKLKDERIKELEEFENKYLIANEMLRSAQAKNLIVEEDLAHVKVKLNVAENTLAAGLEHTKLGKNILEENLDLDKAQVASQDTGEHNSRTDPARVVSEHKGEHNLDIAPQDTRVHKSKTTQAIVTYQDTDKHNSKTNPATVVSEHKGEHNLDTDIAPVASLDVCEQNTDADKDLFASEDDGELTNCNQAVYVQMKRKAVHKNSIQTTKRKRLDDGKDVEIPKITQNFHAECTSPSSQSPTTSDCEVSMISDFDVIKKKILSFTQPLPSLEELWLLTRDQLCLLATELGVSSHVDKNRLIPLIVIALFNKESAEPIPKECFPLYNYNEAVRDLMKKVKKIRQMKARHANGTVNNTTADHILQIKEKEITGSELKGMSWDNLEEPNLFKIRNC